MREGNTKTSTVIFTIGHSTCTLENFINLLRAHGVNTVIDVRTITRSRHNPQFNGDTLPQALREAGVGYVHMKGLGGLRHARATSPNMGWRNHSFRGFADYMQTGEFEDNIQKLLNLRRRNPIALMCAEAVPWRCHRSLIADALMVRDIRVMHIMSITNAKPHILTPWAHVENSQITYPVEQVRMNVREKNLRGESENRKDSG